MDTPLPSLPPAAFRKADPSPDPHFYAQPRFVAHIDEDAIAAVTSLYREVLPPDGVILDLMSSWISYLPGHVRYAEVIGHGMNRDELGANPRLDRWFVQDLNAEPSLPLAERSVDAAAICVSVQYLQRPVELFSALARVLRPGAPVVITFSNRCFPTKAVAIWSALDGPGHCALVELYLRHAGFASVEARTLRDGRRGDPLWAVIGRTAAGEEMDNRLSGSLAPPTR